MYVSRLSKSFTFSPFEYAFDPRWFRTAALTWGAATGLSYGSVEQKKQTKLCVVRARPPPGYASSMCWVRYPWID